MASTTQFELPLLASAQAQKHVTVNEALARLDAVAQLRVVSATLTMPPVEMVDGAAYLVPAAAGGEWAGQTGRIAVAVNGGWIFLAPRTGWRLWDETASDWKMFDGSDWVPGAVVVGTTGAATIHRIVEVDHVLTPGGQSVLSGAIPALAQVIGVTGRVSVAISGTATAWRLGVPGSNDRYGSGLGVAQNSYVHGLSGAPVTYYSETDLLVTAEGGDFDGGNVRISLHLTELRPPRSV